MKTAFGQFDETYHHIDAPTKQDNVLGKQLKKRYLYNPKLVYETIPDIFGGENYEIKDWELEYRDVNLDEMYTNPAFKYLEDSYWTASRKVDGTNLRIKWDGEQAIYCGKTNKANFTPDQKEYIESVFVEEIFEENFRKDGKSPTVIIFAELVGPKIQNGDNGEFKELEAIIYDVKINETFVSAENIAKIANYFGLQSTYGLLKITDTLTNLIEMIASGTLGEIEGIVAKPDVELKTNNDYRLITKIKTRDYLPIKDYLKIGE